jgi:hypothetical protein
MVTRNFGNVHAVLIYSPLCNGKAVNFTNDPLSFSDLFQDVVPSGLVQCLILTLRGPYDDLAFQGAMQSKMSTVVQSLQMVE